MLRQAGNVQIMRPGYYDHQVSMVARQATNGTSDKNLNAIVQPANYGHE
jgi:hypothetical protein